MSDRRQLVTITIVILAAIAGRASADDAPPVQQDADTAKRSTVTSGDVLWSVELDKVDAQVADPIQLVLSLDAPAGTRVRMPVISDMLGAFEVRATQEVNDLPVGEETDVRRWQRRITLETIRSGDMTIPAMTVLFRKPQGTDFQELRSERLQIRVRSVLEDRPDPTKFRDIKDVVDVPVPRPRSWAWAWWTGGAVIMVAVACLALIALRRRQQLSPADWALTQIAELESRQVLDVAGPEALSAEVADILREFMQLRFGVSALTQATDDFLANAARASDLGDGSQQQLAAFLAVADDVKFAQRGLTREDARDATQRAKQFIGQCQSDSRLSAREVN